ncbi:MAG: hypothetical protein GY934_23005, partial [Gammaproteobacteria bacterium]|nr:hypothetical protein [Gammaproteobacteria bacterium]
VTFTLSAVVDGGVPVGLTTITNTAGFSHSSGASQATASLVVSKTNDVNDMLYLSTSRNGTVDGLLFADEDILAYDASSTSWTKLFDGSDVGFSRVDLDAFALLNDGSLLLSPDRPRNLGSLGRVDDSDIVRFIPTTLGENTAGSFEWYFDGSDVGLTRYNEDIDAISVTSDGKLLLSTIGTFAVPGVSGRDEDLIIFTPTSLGENTSGSWARYFDGSDVDLRQNSEDLRGGQIDEASGDIYLTTRGNFSVSGLNGNGADIFICTPGSLGTNTSCTYSTYWIGADHGLTKDVDAFSIGGEVAVSVSSIAKADLTIAKVEVDDQPEEEDVPADDADDEDDSNELHHQDDVSTGAEDDNTTIFLPLIVKNTGSVNAAALSDVVVDSISVTHIAGNSYTITIVARNQGKAVPYSYNFFINAYLNSDLSTPIVVCNALAPDFGTGQSVTCTGQYTFNNGVDTLRGWVDPYNNVSESDEENNTKDVGIVALDGQAVGTASNPIWPAGPLPTPTPTLD